MILSRRAIIFIVILIAHLGVFLSLKSGRIDVPISEEPDASAIAVIFIKPKLVIGTTPVLVDPLVMRISPSALFLAEIPFPALYVPEKYSVGIGTAAPRPGDSLPDIRPYARNAGLHEGESALVVLRIEVIDDNDLGRISVEVSSGSSLIDQVALEYARAMPWVGGLKDGVPAPMLLRYAVYLKP